MTRVRLKMYVNMCLMYAIAVWLPLITSMKGEEEGKASEEGLIESCRP